MAYHPDEILEMAERIETNGAAFYADAARRADDPASRTLLESLARMEADHQRTFARLRSEAADGGGVAAYEDPDGLAIGYLRSMADSRVFSGRALDTSSTAAILRAALAAERDAIAFFTGMRELVPEGPGRAPVDRIIREEMDHVVQLSRRLKAVAGE